jgi:hypothetical protein
LNTPPGEDENKGVTTESPPQPAAQDVSNPPPVLTAAQHMLNVVSLASALIRANGVIPETLGADSLAAYDLVLKAYADSGLPIS